MRVPLVLLGFLALATACGGGGGQQTSPSGLRIETSALPAADVGRPYVAEIVAVGGTGQGNTWRIRSGSLPAGLSFATGRACPSWTAWGTLGQIPIDTGTGERTEISGLAVSRRNPGILWVHDDSGGMAVLHAVDLSGALRQRYVLNVTPNDWEDVCLGPGPNASVEYLYIGDVGDNGSRRDHVTLLRVEEPLVPASPGPEIALAHEAFALAYPGGPRDCEALVVDWATGAPYLLEKSSAGGDAYRVPMPLDPAWTPATPGPLEAVTTTRPLPADVTAADAARDGTFIAYRTYTQAYTLPVLGAGLSSAFTATACSFTAPLLGQYESLGIAPDGLSIYTTTEHTFLQPASSVPVQRASADLEDLPGTLRGAPSAAGTYTITVEVEDASGARAVRTFDLVVR